MLLLLLFALVTQAGFAPGFAAPVARPDEVTYGLILRTCNVVLRGSAGAWSVFSILGVFLQAMFLNWVLMTHKLFAKPNYVPAFLLILFAALSPYFGQFSAGFVAQFFVIGAIHAILRFGHPSQPRRQIFNAGFLLGVATLIQFSCIWYALLLVMAMVLLRPFQPGEWVTAFLGLLTPVYFFAGILFLSDDLPLFRLWPALSIDLPRRVSKPAAFLAGLGGITLLLFTGIYFLQLQMSRSTIFVRRAWGALISGLIASVLVAVFSRGSLGSGWWALAPHFAVVAAPGFLAEKPRRVGTFIFWFSLALVVFIRITG